MKEIASPPRSGDDIRCACGKMLAQWHTKGIMIKCGRRRRLALIPFTAITRRSMGRHGPST